LLAALGLVYRHGTNRPRLFGEYVGAGRHVLFALALLVWLAVLLATLIPAGQRLFLFQQVLHLLVRLVGPLLFVLARPWPVLRAALPKRLRRYLRNLGHQPMVAAMAHVATRLPVAFVVLIGWFYLWQTPPMHNASLASPLLMGLAHLGMALSGVVFFAVVLDGRDISDAATHSLRLLALIGVILSNILLGSLITLKEVVLYTGYDLTGRLWGMEPLADETLGGYTIWVPSSMLIIIAILFAFHTWNAAEVRRWQNRHTWSGSNAAALEFPETAQELHLKVSAPNRQVGRTLALVALSIFLVVLATAITVVSLG
jgi:putative membrane protein